MDEEISAIGGGPCCRGTTEDGVTYVFLSDDPQAPGAHSSADGDASQGKPPSLPVAEAKEMLGEDHGLTQVLVFVPPFSRVRDRWLLGDTPGVSPAETQWKSFVALVTEDIPHAICLSPGYGIQGRVPLPLLERPAVQALLGNPESPAKALIALMIEEDKCGIRESILAALVSSYEVPPGAPRYHFVEVRLPELARTLMPNDVMQAAILWRAARVQASLVLDFVDYFDPVVIEDARKRLSDEEPWQIRALEEAKNPVSPYVVTFIIDKKAFVSIDCSPERK